MIQGLEYPPMADDFSRITIRLKPHEEKAFRALVQEIRHRAGYEVPATEVVKSLMGFKTKLAPLTDEDRAMLRPPEKDKRLTRT